MISIHFDDFDDFDYRNRIRLSKLISIIEIDFDNQNVCFEDRGTPGRGGTGIPKQTEKYSKNDRNLLAAGAEKLTLFVPNTDEKTSPELQKIR